MDEPDWLPEPPDIPSDLLARCRTRGDFRPIFFEWYKYVGLLANAVASIRGDSPGVRAIPALHYATLIGLLNRNARLMFANVALSHEGLFGETTAILDRCIFESCVKVCWLCSDGRSEAFERFIADGLKSELELEKEINANIEKRNGAVLEIERRMLKSIAGAFDSVGLTRDEVANSKKLPDLAAMISAVGRSRLMYVVGQRIGSHHVHGTWISLRTHYLEAGDDGVLRPRDHDCEPHVNQFMYVPMVVLDALRSFAEFALADTDVAAAFNGLINSTSEEIMEINKEASGADFDPAGRT